MQTWTRACIKARLEAMRVQAAYGFRATQGGVFFFATNARVFSCKQQNRRRTNVQTNVTLEGFKIHFYLQIHLQ